MKTHKLMYSSLFLAIGMVLCGGALADNCNGRFNNVTHALSTVEVGEGHTLTSFIFHSITTSDNSIVNAAGECSGYALTTPDGKTRMAGVCARKTAGGDSYSDTWTLEPGADRGTWQMAGGTGAFAGKVMGGWWQIGLQDGKMASGKWGGNCR